MSEVADLMKRCQRGVGGRNALDEAHDIMAECYGTLGRLESERDALRQQLADSDAALRESRANDTAAMGHLADMRQQRDKLAGLLREFREITSEYAWDAELEARIDTALSDLTP